MTKFISLILLSCLTVGPTLAGTEVGNGGGFAEMQAVYAEKQLLTYAANDPRLNDFLNKLTNSDLLALSFDSECYSLNNETLSLHPGKIPSCILYSKNTTALGLEPLAFKQIAAIVFAVRWLQFFPETPWETAHRLGESVFNNISIELKKLPLTWRSEILAALYIWKISDSEVNTNERHLSLELKTETIALDHALEGENLCGNDLLLKYNINYLSLYSANEKRLKAKGPIHWHCQQQSFEGELYLQWDEASSTVNLSVRQRRSKSAVK